MLTPALPNQTPFIKMFEFLPNVAYADSPILTILADGNFRTHKLRAELKRIIVQNVPPALQKNTGTLRYSMMLKKQLVIGKYATGTTEPVRTFEKD